MSAETAHPEQQKNQEQSVPPEALFEIARDKIVPTLDELKQGALMVQELEEAGVFDEQGNMLGDNNSITMEQADFNQLKEHFTPENWLLGKNERIVLGAISHAKEDEPLALESANVIVDAYLAESTDQDPRNLETLKANAKAIIELDHEIRSALHKDEAEKESGTRQRYEEQEAERIFVEEYDKKMQELQLRLRLDRPNYDTFPEETKADIQAEMQRQALVAATYEKDEYLRDRGRIFTPQNQHDTRLRKRIEETEKRKDVVHPSEASFLKSSAGHDVRAVTLESESNDRLPSRVEDVLTQWERSPEGTEYSEGLDRFKSLVKLGLHEVDTMSDLTPKQVDYILGEYAEPETPSAPPAKRDRKREKFRKKQMSKELDSLHRELELQDKQNARLGAAFGNFIRARNKFLARQEQLRNQREVVSILPIAERLLETGVRKPKT